MTRDEVLALISANSTLHKGFDDDYIYRLDMQYWPNGNGMCGGWAVRLTEENPDPDNPVTTVLLNTFRNEFYVDGGKIQYDAVPENNYDKYGAFDTNTPTGTQNITLLPINKVSGGNLAAMGLINCDAVIGNNGKNILVYDDNYCSIRNYASSNTPTVAEYNTYTSEYLFNRMKNNYDTDIQWNFGFCDKTLDADKRNVLDIHFTEEAIDDAWSEYNGNYQCLWSKQYTLSSSNTIHWGFQMECMTSKSTGLGWNAIPPSSGDISWLYFGAIDLQFIRENNSHKVIAQCTYFKPHKELYDGSTENTSQRVYKKAGTTGDKATVDYDVYYFEKCIYDPDKEYSTSYYEMSTSFDRTATTNEYPNTFSVPYYEATATCRLGYGGDSVMWEWDNSSGMTPTYDNVFHKLSFDSAEVTDDITLDWTGFTISGKVYDGSPLSSTGTVTPTTQLPSGVNLVCAFSPALSECVDADTYTISVTYHLEDGNGNTVSTIGIINPTQSFIAVISPKLITVTKPSNITKTYDGCCINAVTPTHTSLVGNDVFVVEYSPVLSNFKDVVRGANNAVASQSLTLSYHIETSSGALSRNYTLSPSAQTIAVTINPKTLTVNTTASIPDKIYDGSDTVGNVTMSSTATGWVSNNTCGVYEGGSFLTTYSPSKYASSGVSGSSTTFTFTTTTTGNSGTKMSNYNVTTNYTTNGVSGRTVTKSIGAKTIVISCDDFVVADKVYDGNSISNCVTSIPNPSGLLNGAYLDVSYDNNVMSNKNAGTYTIVATFSIKESGGATSANYSLSTTQCSKEVVVSRAPLSITYSCDVDDKIYDGTTSATITKSGTVTGWVTGESGSLTSTVAPSVFASKNVANSTTTFTFTFAISTGSGTSISNYSYNNQNLTSSFRITETKQAQIFPKPLSLEMQNNCPYFDSVATCETQREYNGSSVGEAKFPEVSFNASDFVTDEGATISQIKTLDTNNPTPDKSVGTYRASCVLQEVPNSITDMSNYEYTLPTMNDAVCTITAKDVSIEGVVYACNNGTWSITNNGSLVGVVSGDNVSHTISLTTTEGTGDTVNLNIGGTLTGSDAGNYRLLSTTVRNVSCSDYTTCRYASVRISPYAGETTFDSTTAYRLYSTVETIDNIRYMIVRCYLPYGEVNYPSAVRVLACRTEYGVSPGIIPNRFSTQTNTAYDELGNLNDIISFYIEDSHFCVCVTCNTSQNARGFRYWEAKFPINETTNGVMSPESSNTLGVDIPYTFYVWSISASCKRGEILKASFPAVQRVLETPGTEAHNIFLVTEACDESVLDNNYTGLGSTWALSTDHNLYNALVFARDGDTILFSKDVLPQNVASAPVVSSNLTYEFDYGVVIDASKPYKISNGEIVEDTSVANWYGVSLECSNGYAIFDVDTKTNKPCYFYNLTFEEGNDGFGCQCGISSFSPCFVKDCKFRYITDYGIFAFDTITIRNCYFMRCGRTYQYTENNTDKSYSVGGGVWLRLASEVSCCLFFNNANGIRNGQFSHISNNTIVFDLSNTDTEIMTSTAYAISYYAGCYNNFIAGYPVKTSTISTDYPPRNNICMFAETNLNSIMGWTETSKYLTIFDGGYGSSSAYDNVVYYNCNNRTEAPFISSFCSSNYAPINTNEYYGYTLIDRGDNSYVTGTTDFAGNIRIYGTDVDIGCYEYYPGYNYPTFEINNNLSIVYDGQAHKIVGVSSELQDNVTLCILSDDFDYTGYDSVNTQDLDNYINGTSSVVYHSAHIPTITYVSDTDWVNAVKVIVSIPGYQSWVGLISAQITARPITVSGISLSYKQKL